LNLARVCRNLNSWGCRVGCAIPNGMVTDVHMSVGDAQQCSRPQKCKCVYYLLSRLMMPAVCYHVVRGSTTIETQQKRTATHGPQTTKLSVSIKHAPIQKACLSMYRSQKTTTSKQACLKRHVNIYTCQQQQQNDQGWQQHVSRQKVTSSTEMLGRHMLSDSRHCQHLLLTYDILSSTTLTPAAYTVNRTEGNEH